MGDTFVLRLSSPHICCTLVTGHLLFELINSLKWDWRMDIVFLITLVGYLLLPKIAVSEQTVYFKIKFNGANL